MITPLTCSRCGGSGLHACPGRPIEPMSEEKRKELIEVLKRVQESEQNLPEHLRGRTVAR